jgi:hypothetical protein
MWSLTSPLARRISGPRKFCSSPKKDFFNTIGTLADIAILPNGRFATSGHAFDVAFELYRILITGFTSARPPRHDIGVAQVRRVF